jgi:hypothetical protein
VVDVEIRDIEPQDIDELVRNMRQADRDEVKASSPLSLKSVITHSVQLSSYSKAGLVNGELACMWGVCPVSLLSSKGSPWLLATYVIEKHPMAFLRRCKPVIKKLRDSYSNLENYVDARNDVAIHWLKWMGFKMEEPKPWGINGLEFHKFTMRTKNV